MNKRRYVMGMDVVAHLLALVTEYPVLPLFDVAFDQVAQEAMQLYAGVIGPGQASTAQAGRRNIEISPVLLHHDVRRDLRSAKQRVLGLVDREILSDAMLIMRIIVVPTGLEFLHLDRIGPVAVD